MRQDDTNAEIVLPSMVFFTKQPPELVLGGKHTHMPLRLACFALASGEVLVLFAPPIGSNGARCETSNQGCP